jgi:hypothetical protein
MVMAMFAIHLKQQDDRVAESFYELVPETKEEEEKRLLEELASKLPQTNSAFDEDQEFKDLMKNFKSMNSNDFEKTMKSIEEEQAMEDDSDVLTQNPRTTSPSNGNYALNDIDKSSYNKIKDKLAMHTQDASKKGVNANSSVTYSLSGRKIQDHDTPRYLCEVSGKMVINITVNGEGIVTDAYVNTSSTSNNECLIDHALEYAKLVTFDSSSRASQLGSITFYFKGKN